MYCQIPFGVLQCFYCYFDFSKQHFTRDNNEKKKPQPQIQNHPLPASKKLLIIFTQTRTSNFNQPASYCRFLFWESREKSRESSTRKKTRVREAGCEARTLATRFAFQQAKLQQLSFALFILMTISFDCGTLTLFAVYKLYWLLILYFHFHYDLERSEIASNGRK